MALFVYLPAPVDSGISLDHLQRVGAWRAASCDSDLRSEVHFRLPLELVLTFGRIDNACASRAASSRTGASTHGQRCAHGLADDGRLRRNACAN